MKALEMCGKKFSDLFDSITIFVDVFFRGFSLILCGVAFARHPQGQASRGVASCHALGKLMGCIASQWLSDFAITWGFPKRMVPPFHTPSADHF